jgi:hypothetical protein
VNTAVVLAALAASHGSATLTTGGLAAESLRAQGVKVPAKVSLPVTAGTAGTLDLGKRLTLRRGKRSVSFTRWQARLGKRATLTARVRGRRIVVLQGPAKGLRLAEDSAVLQRAPLSLSRTAARAIKRRLRLRRAPRGRLGRVTIVATLRGAPPATPAPVSGGGGGGTKPGGGGGGTNPPPATDPLPTLTRPAGAVDVVSATITWHARESFVDDINSGGGTSTENGATQEGTYNFHYPFKRGWTRSSASTASARC